MGGVIYGVGINTLSYEMPFEYNNGLLTTTLRPQDISLLEQKISEGPVDLRLHFEDQCYNIDDVTQLAYSGVVGGEFPRLEIISETARRRHSDIAFTTAFWASLIAANAGENRCLYGLAATAFAIQIVRTLAELRE